MKATTIISIVVVLILVIFLVLNNAKDKISLKLNLNKSKIDIVGVVSNFDKQDFVKTSLNFEVENENSFSITIRDFSLKVLYKNEIVLEAIDTGDSIYIERNSSSSVFLPSKVYTNNKAIEAAGMLVAKKPIDLDYEVKGKLWYIPFYFKGNFTYTGK